MREFFHAVGTDVLALEDGDILGAVAEDAGRLILFEHDRGAVYIDLQGVLLRDVERAAQLDGQDDTTELVDAANDACRFHDEHILSNGGGADRPRRRARGSAGIAKKILETKETS